MEILLVYTGLELGNILLQNGYGDPSFPSTASLVSMPRERVRRERLEKENYRSCKGSGCRQCCKTIQAVPRALRELADVIAGSFCSTFENSWQLWKDPDDFHEGQCHTLLQKAQKEGSGMAGYLSAWVSFVVNRSSLKARPRM